MIGWAAAFIGISVCLAFAVIGAGACFDDINHPATATRLAVLAGVCGVVLTALAVLLAVADLIILAAFALVVWNHV